MINALLKYLKKINWKDPTIVASLVGVFGVVAGGGLVAIVNGTACNGSEEKPLVDNHNQQTVQVGADAKDVLSGVDTKLSEYSTIIHDKLDLIFLHVEMNSSPPEPILDDDSEIIKIAKKLDNKGYDHGVAGEWGEAVGFIKSSLIVRPNSKWTLTALGVALNRLGKQDEAMASFRDAIRLDPNFVDAHFGLGLVSDKIGNLDDAVASYRETIRLSPEENLAHTSLGFILFSQGMRDEAISCFREAVRLDPKNSKFHHYLGSHLKLHGKTDQALASFREVVRLDPENAEAHYYKSCLLIIIGGLTAEAIGSLKTAIMLDEKYRLYAKTNVELLRVKADPAFRKLVYEE